MKPHHHMCGCAWCQENRESVVRHEALCGRALDDWPERPPRRQRGLIATAIAGCVFGALAGSAAVAGLVMWLMTT